MLLTDEQWRVDTATPDDVPQIADLLRLLYEAEAPEMVPEDTEAFTSVLASALHGQGRTAIESNLIARDAEDPSVVGGSVALSCSHNPRRPPFTRRYIADAFRHLPAREAIRLLWRQYRLMALMCAPLPPRTAQMHSLVVRPELRGQGLAVRLIHEVEEQARANDQQGLSLFVLDGNPVEPFYERLGYRRIPVPRPEWPLPNPGITMYRPL